MLLFALPVFEFVSLFHMQDFKFLVFSSIFTIIIISRPRRSQGLLCKHLRHSLIHWLSHPLVNIYLRRRHAQTIKNGAFSDKINYIDSFSAILNPEGHQNNCIGFKVTEILLNGWILPTGGGASGRVCACSHFEPVFYCENQLVPPDHRRCDSQHLCFIISYLSSINSDLTWNAV